MSESVQEKRQELLTAIDNFAILISDSPMSFDQTYEFIAKVRQNFSDEIVEFIAERVMAFDSNMGLKMKKAIAKTKPMHFELEEEPTKMGR